jgi:hypothetical protein
MWGTLIASISDLGHPPAASASIEMEAASLLLHNHGLNAKAGCM